MTWPVAIPELFGSKALAHQYSQARFAAAA
jgi:hypothetical protein